MTNLFSLSPLFIYFFNQAVNCKGQHSISYTLSRNQTVVVEYCHDKDTDMFQVNRHVQRISGLIERFFDKRTQMYTCVNIYIHAFIQSDLQ